MVMAVADLDRALARWEQDVTNAFLNLVELQKEFAFEAVFGDNPFVELEGISKAKVEPVRNNFKDLWKHFSLVQNEIDRAKGLRARERRPSQKTLAEIEEILTGHSIDQPDVNVPLQQRGLLSPASTVQNKMSCTELMQSMVKAFDQTRELTFAIGKVWSEFMPKLDKLKAEADQLRAQSKELCVGEQVELLEFDMTIAPVEDKVRNDPLGATGISDTTLRPLLDKVRSRLAALKQQVDSLVLAIAKEEGSFPEMEALHAACEEKRLEVFDAIDRPEELPRSKLALARLHEWVSKLKVEAATNPVVASQRFSNCKAALDEWRLLESAADKGYGALLEEREQLKTRLRMYRDTAARKHYKGRVMVEDPQLLTIGAEAEKYLARPCRLELARASVNSYHGRLRNMEDWAKQEADSVSAEQL